MTQPEQDNISQLTGNGVTTSFPFPHKFFKDAHLAVKRLVISTGVESVVPGSEFTIVGEGLAAGGSVDFTIAPTSDHRITINRETPYEQTSDYVANQGFPAQAHEDAVDKLVQMCQRLEARMDKAFAVNDSSPLTFSTQIAGQPAAGRAVFVNSAVTALEFSATDLSDLNDAVNDAETAQAAAEAAQTAAETAQTAAETAANAAGTIKFQFCIFTSSVAKLTNISFPGTFDKVPLVFITRLSANVAVTPIAINTVTKTQFTYDGGTVGEDLMIFACLPGIHELPDKTVIGGGTGALIEDANNEGIHVFNQWAEELMSANFTSVYPTDGSSNQFQRSIAMRNLLTGSPSDGNFNTFGSQGQSMVRILSDTNPDNANVAFMQITQTSRPRLGSGNLTSLGAKTITHDAGTVSYEAGTMFNLGAVSTATINFSQTFASAPMAMIHGTTRDKGSDVHAELNNALPGTASLVIRTTVAATTNGIDYLVMPSGFYEVSNSRRLL